MLSPVLCWWHKGKRPTLWVRLTFVLSFYSLQAIPTCRYRPCLRSWPKRATTLPDNRRRSRTFSPRLWTCRRKQSWYETTTCATLTEIHQQCVKHKLFSHTIFIKIYIVCCWERGADAALGCSQRRPEAAHCGGEKTEPAKCDIATDSSAYCCKNRRTCTYPVSTVHVMKCVRVRCARRNKSI